MVSTFFKYLFGDLKQTRISEEKIRANLSKFITLNFLKAMMKESNLRNRFLKVKCKVSGIAYNSYNYNSYKFSYNFAFSSLFSLRKEFVIQ